LIYIIIILVIIFLFWFFFHEKKTKTTNINNIEKETLAEIKESTESTEEILLDANGKEYWINTREIKIPRKTYLRGFFSGKYRGEIIETEEVFHNTSNFEFEIYEAEITCQEYRENEPYKNKGVVFPKEKLPETLQATILQNEKWYGLNILEPKLFNFSTIKKLHQTDGNEIFGTFNSEITGYILDYKTKYVDEVIYKDELIKQIDIKNKKTIERLVSSGVETGEFEIKGNYIRRQYYATNFIDTIWGDWLYNKKIKNTSFSNGCFSSLFSIIGFTLGLLFLFTILPGLIYVVPFIVILLLISAFQDVFKWIFRIAGLLFILFFIGTLIHSFSQSNSVKPKPIYVDNSRERRETIEPIVENNSTFDNQKENDNIENDDYLIKKYREWSDYDGNFYGGYYTLRKSEIIQSVKFKNNLNKQIFTESNYDEIIFDLKENDKSKLQGVYKLFDSIGNSNKLNKIQFAEMVVTFVQDIPYVLILEKDCDPNLYTDNFTRTYLRTNQGKCSGFQKFGINSPVEFLHTLDGDCDTRTLLIYTILSHYNYDVAIMSSEFYGHSILGVNLPLNGLKYKYQNQNYVLWETTQRNIKPGKISSEISNLNYWRISLKSK
jgi:energy-coupling factor transporter transmembrane protein EcfT